MPEVRIKINPDGCYHVFGEVTLVDHNGNAFPVEPELWLCRCGHSKRKPFCDGSHKRAGFQSRVDAAPPPGE